VSFENLLPVILRNDKVLQIPLNLRLIDFKEGTFTLAIEAFGFTTTIYTRLATTILMDMNFRIAVLAPHKP